MLSVFLLSAIFLMFASVFGIPLSSTHTVVAALIGAGTIAAGWDNINKSMLIKIVVSWVVSPLSSGIICSIFYYFLKKALKARVAAFKRLLTMECLGAFAFGLTYLLII